MRRLIWIALLGLISMAEAQGAETSLRLGKGAVKITPPLGTPLAGYYYPRGADGVHDDLFAKTLLLESGDTQVALVACDLIEIPRAVAMAVRQRAEKELGIPGRQIMISATHCHTGPLLGGDYSRKEALGGGSGIARDYLAALPGRIVESLRQASASLAPAQAWQARGREEHLSFNRRFRMKDGSIGWNPGKLNPGLLHPVGPIDPDVPVLFFADTNGRPLAAYVNFAMHLDTVGGSQFSADYPYTLAKLLAAAKGPELLTLFTLGTAGNLNHLDFFSGSPQQGHEEGARIGTVLAGNVLQALNQRCPVQGGQIQVRQEIVKLPLVALQSGEVEKAREISGRFGKANEAPFLDNVYAFKVLDVADHKGEPVSAEIQVITWGEEIAWVGLPGEIFVEFGKAIKMNSPFPLTIVVELANGSIGYVVNRKGHAEGNYEPVSSRVAEGSGELLTDRAIQLLVDCWREARRQNGR